MTLGSEEEIVATEDQIFNVTTRSNNNVSGGVGDHLYPYLPATYLGFLCVVGIVANSFVIFFFAAFPVVSQRDKLHIIKTSLLSCSCSAYICNPLWKNHRQTSQVTFFISSQRCLYHAAALSQWTNYVTMYHASHGALGLKTHPTKVKVFLKV